MENNKDVMVYFEIAGGNNHDPSTDYVFKKIVWSEPMQYFCQPLREPYSGPSLKKYHCDHCVKSFNKARNRKRHVKLHHTP